MIDPISIAVLVTVLHAVARKEPIPILSELLNPHSGEQPTPKAMSTQPRVPPERANSITYLKEGVRYFRETVCGNLFELARSCTLEEFATKDRQQPPGMRRLVQWTPGTVRASDAFLQADARGLSILFSLASACDEYEDVDKIVMFTAHAGAANVSTQWAVLGPFPRSRARRADAGAMPLRPVGATLQSDGASKAAKLEEELKGLEALGLPANIVQAALSNPDASPSELDNVATLLDSFPAVKSAVEVRAKVLRAKRALETVAPAKVSFPEPGLRKASNGAVAEPVTVEVVDVNPIKDAPSA